MEDAPNRIRELRIEKGWSIQRLADAINMSKMNVSQIERGLVDINLGNMRRFAQALGVTTADLLSIEDNPDALGIRERELVQRMRAADSEDRERFRGVASVILPFKHADGDSDAA